MFTLISAVYLNYLWVVTPRSITKGCKQVNRKEVRLKVVIQINSKKNYTEERVVKVKPRIQKIKNACLVAGKNSMLKALMHIFFS